MECLYQTIEAAIIEQHWHPIYASLMALGSLTFLSRMYGIILFVEASTTYAQVVHDCSAQVLSRVGS